MSVKSCITISLLIFICNSCFAQKHEFGIHVTAINSINRPTDSSDKYEYVKTFYSIAPNFGFDYFYRLKKSNNRLYLSLTYSSIKTRVKFNTIPRPDLPNPTSSSGGSARIGFWGLKYGFNKQGFLLKNTDLSIGFFTKLENETFLGLGGISCSQYECEGNFIRSDYYFTDKIGLHTSLFLKLDFALFKSKRSKHFMNAHLILNYGFQKIRKNYHYLKNVLTDEEFNFELVNRGSYFGLGLSYRIGSSNDKIKSIFRFKAD